MTNSLSPRSICLRTHLAPRPQRALPEACTFARCRQDAPHRRTQFAGPAAPANATRQSSASRRPPEPMEAPDVIPLYP
jgi:hypothetical protein